MKQQSVRAGRLVVAAVSFAALAAAGCVGNLPPQSGGGDQAATPASASSDPASSDPAASGSDDPSTTAAEQGPSDEPTKDNVPLLPEDALELGYDQVLSKRRIDPSEKHGGLDKSISRKVRDELLLGAPLPAIEATIADVQPVALPPGTAHVAAVANPTGDDDKDCLSNADEAKLGTDPKNPDSDGDGWFDGPCNERRKLYLEKIKAHDEQEDMGEDELYLIVDDIRYPNGDLDDWWDFDDGDQRTYNTLLATRVRGKATTSGLAIVHIEGWEDDYETFNEWTVDDHLFSKDIDLAAYSNGQKFSKRMSGDDDWDYELWFRVEIEKFADPNPKNASADSDGDGITEANEYKVSKDFGGMADPQRKEIFIELNWMPGHSLATEAKRIITTQMFRYGYKMNVYRNREVPKDGCLTVPQAKNYYNSYFSRKAYKAYRYAMMTEEIWNDASGVAWYDMFLIDDSTWWIDGGVLAQSGTLIHELGHTLGLNQSVFARIDKVTVPFIDCDYDSAMNYFYQATMQRYSGSNTNGCDHNDVEDVKAAYGLQGSFAGVTSTEQGICN